MLGELPKATIGTMKSPENSHKKKPSQFRGDRLRALREARNQTQEDLNKQAGLGAGSIQRYESGESNPLPEALAALSKALDTSADFLIGLTHDAESHYIPEKLSNEERSFILMLRSGKFVQLIQILAQKFLKNTGKKGDSEGDNKD